MNCLSDKEDMPSRHRRDKMSARQREDPEPKDQRQSTQGDCISGWIKGVFEGWQCAFVAEHTVSDSTP